MLFQVLKTLFPITSRSEVRKEHCQHSQVTTWFLPVSSKFNNFRPAEPRVYSIPTFQFPASIERGQNCGSLRASLPLWKGSIDADTAVLKTFYPAALSCVKVLIEAHQTRYNKNQVNL